MLAATPSSSAETTEAPRVRSSARRRERIDPSGNGNNAGEVRRTLQTRRLIGFAAAFGLTLLLAFEGGGYDVVIRQKLGLAIWALIALGLATGFFPRGRLNRGARLALGGFAGLAALMLVAHSWTLSDERTTAEMCRALQYLGIVTLAYLGLNRHTWHGAAAGFAAAALAVPFFAVGSRLFPTVLVDHVAQQLFVNRLSYPLNYWNAVACWGAMALAIALCISAQAPRRSVRAIALSTVPVAMLCINLAYSRFGIVVLPIALIAALALSRHRWTLGINAFGAFFVSSIPVFSAGSHPEIANGTGSAGAGSVIFGLVLAGLLCAGIALWTRRCDSWRLTPFAARRMLAVLGVLGLLFIAAIHGSISHAWNDFKTGENPTSNAAAPTSRLASAGGYRYQVWQGALDAFKTDPERGIGPGTFELYWDQHGDTAQFISNPHSLYLEQLGELGVFGLLAILVVIGGLLAAAITAWRRWTSDWDLTLGPALITAFVVFAAYAATDWMWEVGAVGALAFGGCAVAGAGGFGRERPRALRGWAKLAAVACCLLFAAAQVPTLLMTQHTRDSSTALAADDPGKAVDLAQQAIDAEPWAASPYSASALAYSALGRFDQARSQVDVAIRREPTNWRFPLVRARVDAMAGDRAQAEHDLAEVRRLAPQSLLTLQGQQMNAIVDKLLRESQSSPISGTGP
jgi:tetratricopeptide (TPR) repeat protein